MRLASMPLLLVVAGAALAGPAWATQARADAQLGPPELDWRAVSRLAREGVTVAYVHALRAEGLDGLTAHDLERLEGNGLTADSVREARAAGWRGSDAHDLVRMKRRGIDVVLGGTRERGARR